MHSKAFAPPTLDDRLLWDYWLSVHQFPVLAVADEIGLFGSLREGPRTTESLASEFSASPRVLEVYMGYLAAMKLLSRDGELWRATPLGSAWLDPDSGGYWGPLLSAFKHSHPVHRQMLDSLGESAASNNPQSAIKEWERGELPRSRADLVAGFMNSHSIAAATALAPARLLAEANKLLDVGGGSGVYAIAAAKAHPHLQATVIEIDTMCEAADEYIRASGVQDRIDTLPLNMFTEELPGGFDTHLYSNVFHDWSERTNALLAAKSFEALPSGGSILVHEMLVDEDGCGPLTTLAFSILMVLGTRGKQYSFSELENILAGAGFVEIASQPTGSGYFSLVSAVKP